MKPVSRRRAHSGASVPPDWGWLAPHPSTNNHSMLVCTLLQSRKVLVSVVWTTSNAPHFHWTRHRPTACSGSAAHHITSRANLVLWHMHVPLPWHMHLLSPYDRPLPCHQTRPANSNSTLLSSASDRRSARRFIALCDRDPTIFATIRFVHSAWWSPWRLYTITSRWLGDDTLVPLTQPLRREPSTIPIPITCMHFGALYPAFTAFGLSNIYRI
jgi:hypothetical protein